jgi:5-methylcytosine-specific restriction endonuclease McrA
VSDAKPYPKAQQLARGAKRYRRKIAGPKAWQAITAAKIGPCRVCVQPSGNGHGFNTVELHHVLPRDLGGDDVAENIAPVCRACHLLLTVRDPEASRALCASLTDAEYAYAVTKFGENIFERVYGIEYER